MHVSTVVHLRAGVVDLGRREIVRGSEVVALSEREAALFAWLTARPGQVVSRAELLTEVWGYRATVETRAIDVTMRRLREKVEVNAAEPDHLLTRHGGGYVFEPGTAAPSGPPPGPEVTLMFTDIQASTAAWEVHGDRFAPVLARHDEILRARVHEQGGYEVKSAGDGFVFAFADPAAAVRAALAIQERLAAEDFGPVGPVMVRIGAHVGEAVARQDPVTGRVDWFGPTVNRAARVAAAAHGGQIVVTDVLRARVSVEARWTCLGDHRFHGVPGTTRVWEVVPASLENRRFPPLRALKRSNLPAQVDRFIGREAELKDLAARFAQGARVVTLLGPGGTGKTRLALEHANSVQSDAVWFCDLVEAKTEAEVCRAVAGCLGELLSEDPAAHCGRLLAERGRGRLILDNAEQVVEGVAQLVRRWTSMSPQTTFLVTSRQALRVPGEQIAATGPLAEDDAVALFVERARAANATFAADEEDIRMIVRKLDAWPLALELAAVRTRVLTVAQLRERLRERFRVLTGGTGGPRHSALREVLLSSWEALPEREQSVFAQLAVFVGGFTLDAAEAVVAVDDAIGGIAALVDHALLRLDHASGRYSMLVTVREFALEKLTGEARVAAEIRHGQYLAAHAANPDAAETDNLVAACARAVQRRDVAVAVPCAGGLGNLFYARGPYLDGARIVHEVLDIAPPHDRALLAFQTGVLSFLGGKVEEGEALLTEALPDGTVGHRAGVALGIMAREQGRSADAMRLLRESAARAAAAKDHATEAAAWSTLGDTLIQLGMPDDALAAHERGMALARSAGSTREIARAYAAITVYHSWYSHPSLAIPVFDAARKFRGSASERAFDATVDINWTLFCMERGWFEEAESACEAALSLYRATGHRRREGVALALLGYIAVIQGGTEAARERLDEAIDMLHEVGDRRMAAHARGFMGLLHLREGHPALAVDAVGTACQLAEENADPILLGTLLGFRGWALVEAGDRAAARAELDAAVSRLGTGGRPYARAWVWVSRARLEAACQDAAATRAAVAEVERLSSEVAIGEASDVGRRLALVRRLAGKM